MKKLNSRNRHFIVCGMSVLFCLILLFFPSCKTVVTGNSVKAIDLLDNKSGFYIAVPKSVDSDLLKKIITENTDGISDKDINSIIERIDKIYAGLNRSKHETVVQMTVDGNIPKQFVPKVLNKKHGWTTEIFTPEKSSQKYSIYKQNNINLSFPSNGIACFGRDINQMIQSYDDFIKLPQQDERLTNENSLNDEIYEYLSNAKSEIRFYANKPQSFLTILTGSNLDLKLIEVSGDFNKDPENEEQYILNFSFKFKTDKYLKAGKALLRLAFGLTSSDLENPEPAVLNVKNIHIDKAQVYKLLKI